MPTIDIDFEVFKELTIRRKSEAMTENEVIRELLGMHLSKPGSPKRFHGGNENPWVVKGVYFPHGTEFRATYKGQQYSGIVKNGALVVNGKRHSSPSAAAATVTGNNVNGWQFWQCLKPGETEWKVLTLCR